MDGRKGILFKWTNYVHGWQSRFFVVKNGILMYYRSEQETSFGCRGAISIMASTLTLHEFDCCRFDVGVSDYVWYLRASSKEERDEWLKVLNLQAKQLHQQKQQQINGLNLINDGLELSLNNQTITDTPYIEAPIIPQQQQQQHQQQQQQQRPILPSSDAPTSQQQDEPSEFFDAIDDQILIDNAKIVKPDSFDNSNLVLSSNSFKASHNGHITIGNGGQFNTNHESNSDNDIKTTTNNTNTTANTNITSNNGQHYHQQSIQHPLWPKIDLITSEQLYYAQMGLGQQGSQEGWQLFAEDGQMRMYTREMEIDGLVCDPLKAVHVVKGITGYETCHRFYSPDVRFEWEQTLESMKVVEEIDKDTQIFHQIHKRVWPAAQRDAVFWSHIRKVTEPKSSCLSPDDICPKNRPGLRLHDVWIVCNNSADKPDIPLDRCVRVRLTVSLVCETYVSANLDSNLQGITRDDLTCKIIYSSTINPGGWAPASVLRALYKREYPKFLKNFANYVLGSTENKPILFE